MQTQGLPKIGAGGVEDLCERCSGDVAQFLSHLDITEGGVVGGALHVEVYQPREDTAHSEGVLVGRAYMSNGIPVDVIILVDKGEHWRRLVGWGG